MTCHGCLLSTCECSTATVLFNKIHPFNLLVGGRRKMRRCLRCKAGLLLPLPLRSFPSHNPNLVPTQFITTRNIRRRSHSLSLPSPSSAIAAPTHSTPLQGDLVTYMVGEKKATEVAHLVWRHVLRKGDTAVDATCGNGYDTLAMLRMVADEWGRGCVLGMDIQRDAISKTASLLDASLTPEEKRLVKLFNMCHSRMGEIVPEHNSVRLVAFNLGYLPGGDRAITTASETTLLALEAAKKILAEGGLISLVVYVGHPGGREELETVEAFASGLSVDEWTCSKFQMLNRPLAPVLVHILKK